MSAAPEPGAWVERHEEAMVHEQAGEAAAEMRASAGVLAARKAPQSAYTGRKAQKRDGGAQTGGRVLW